MRNITHIPINLIQRIHFVGIGGIGMSAIAEIFHNLGCSITGSDISENYIIKRLRKIGIKIYIGHNKKNVIGSNLIVISSAINENNPEVLAANFYGITIVKRSEILCELMKLKSSIAISGTHGKTTTTALMACLFEKANLDPTVINGGIINSYNSNSKLGKGDWVIVEADESDGSFTQLPSLVSIITNINYEHLDYYKNFNSIKNSYSDFIRRVPFYGLSVLCNDDPNICSILKEFKGKYITYGFNESAQVKANNLRLKPNGICFDVYIKEGCYKYGMFSNTINKEQTILKDLFLSALGVHNVLNSLSVISVAYAFNIDPSLIYKTFKEFLGVKRRFSKVFNKNDILIIDDYAHHPNEIQGVIIAAKQINPRRIITIIQPHRYTRVRDLWNQFLVCALDSDIIIFLPIYSAGEDPIDGITSELLCESIKRINTQHKMEIYLIHSPKKLLHFLNDLLRSGDLVLFLGAGDITDLALDISKNLKI